MHIPDGILPLPITLGGYVLAVSVTWACLHRINQREDPREGIPKAALLTAAFFLASLIHIPLPPASVHLVLNGLLGILLGPFAFPAIIIGLFFQAVMFGHGGLTTLGVNAIILGGPALAAAALFSVHTRVNGPSPGKVTAFAFLAGVVAVSFSVLLFAACLLIGMPAHIDAVVERSALTLLVLSHIPLIVLEGLIVGLVAAFLFRVRPHLLEGL
ncbi:cobalt transporter CbiM [Desulfobulbus alkaliphilus]|uniref:cobalt transporter CbiM n=1 Tax=Desulfobulbus alkaliphilus TaxID=869814 RepID=UPI001965E9C6|nr:cobalt transporter CbiM [Desulfobulbus alkaliphilus]MBM9536076.1 cobalt transporter CbiM [Desulfobulbus alkaliphilus]